MFNGKNRLVYAKLKQMMIWFSKGTFLNFFTKHTAFCKKIKPKTFVAYKPFLTHKRFLNSKNNDSLFVKVNSTIQLIRTNSVVFNIRAVTASRI